MKFLEDEEQKDVLWVSDSPNMPTGYGVQTAHVCKGIAEKGWNLNCIGGQHVGMPIRTPILDILPGAYMNTGYGSSTAHYHIKNYDPKYVISLSDLWATGYLQGINRKIGSRYWSWIHWLPVDGYVYGKQWQEFYNVIDVLVAMSKFGYNQLSKDKPDDARTELTYIPHGIDTNHYRYMSENERKEIKFQMGEHLEIPDFEDKFVILTVGRNQPRKDFPTTAEVMKKINEKYDDIFWLIHASPNDPAGNNLYWVLQQNEILYNREKKTGCVGFTNLISNPFFGISSKDMTRLYNVADIHLLPTKGEGFGVPIVESLAAGIPNILTNSTTSPEFLNPDNVDLKGGMMTRHGWLVPHLRLEMMQGGVRRSVINPDALYDAIVESRESSILRAIGKNASEYICKNYSFDHVVSEWDKLLKRLDDSPSKESSYYDFVNGVIYNEDYFKARQSDAKAEYFKNELKIMQKYIGEDDSIIDVGCGTGDLLYLLNNGKRALLGLDMSEEAVNITRSKGIFALRFDANSDESYWQYKADIMIAQHTIEHLPQPMLFMEHMVKHANKYAIIVFPYKNMRDLTHRTKFDKEAIEFIKEKILNDMGHRVDEIVIESSLPYSYVMIIKIGEKQQ